MTLLLFFDKLKGDAAALTLIGEWYMMGEFGLTQDCDQALQHFDQAVQQGSATAMYNLSRLHKVKVSSN